MCDHNKLYVPMMVYVQYCGRVQNQKSMQIHNKKGENEISEFYYKRSNEDPP